MTNTDTADEDMKSFWEREYSPLPESTWRPIWDVYVTAVMQIFDDARAEHDVAVRAFSDEIIAAADKGANAERYRRRARTKWEDAGLRIWRKKRNRLCAAQEQMERAIIAARREAQR